ncbi:MAG TPA: hypothetical protein VFG68_15570 [Fimbriiglobus sp.]|nr:hypothetical protein [Fimbriiglobus sp.]
MSYRRSLVLKGVILVLLAVAVSGGFAWIADGAVDYYRDRHLRRVRDGADPATLALADGKFKPGDSITRLLTRYPPKYVFRHDAYTTAEYYNGNRVTMAVARDSRLIFAAAGGSGQRPYTFFDTFAPGESLAYHASRERIVSMWIGAMAAVGPTAIIHCIPLDSPDPGHPK